NRAPRSVQTRRHSRFTRCMVRLRPLVFAEKRGRRLGEVAMRMRLLLVGVLALAAVAMLIWLRSHPGARPNPLPVASPSASSNAPVPLAPSPSASVSRETSADVPAPRVSQDGQIEILVKSERGLIAGARVHLHLRGPRDPNTSVVKWHSLGSSVTGRDGKARF